MFGVLITSHAAPRNNSRVQFARMRNDGRPPPEAAHPDIVVVSSVSRALRYALRAASGSNRAQQEMYVTLHFLS